MATFEEEEPSIVLRGSFNPAIFQPAWFGRHGLVRESEAESAKVTIISQELAQFTIGRVEYLATNDRVQVKTSDVSHEAVLRDLVVGTFTLLDHVPVNVLGVNRTMHLRLDGTRETWNRVGDTLAPKACWHDLVPRAGMRVLTIESERDDGLQGLIVVTVSPSPLVHNGLFVNVNHHIVLGSRAPLERAIELLQSRWEPLQSHSKKIAKVLAERASEASK